MSFKTNLSLDNIDKYLAAFKAQGYEQSSVKLYKTYLLSLLEFCKKQCEGFQECSRADVINFKVELMSRFKPVTVNCYLAVIREFFRYLEREDIGKDITKGIENLKLERVVPSFVRSEELNTLLDQVDNDPSLFVFQSPKSAMINARDIAIFETVFGTGIKAKQLCEIKRSDIDIAMGYLQVHSKGAYRTIPIPRHTLNAITKYSEYREKVYQQSPYFFIYRTGVKFHPRCVNRVCSKFLNKTASKNKGPQTLRNTYVNVLVEGGANIQAIKYLAGYHSFQRTNEKIAALSMATNTFNQFTASSAQRQRTRVNNPHKRLES